jgi:hypothetical protein
MESTPRTYTDLSYLAELPEPPSFLHYPSDLSYKDLQARYFLVYDRGDGSTVTYETSLGEAWAQCGNPYDLLVSAYEDYDDAGNVYFVKEQS